MNAPEDKVRKDIAGTYRESSAMLGERVQDHLRQAIFEAAREQVTAQNETQNETHDKADAALQAPVAGVKASDTQDLRKGSVLADMLRALWGRFAGPWPYAAATAMLAVLAVTVAVRVSTQADKQERQVQMPVPSQASPAAEGAAAPAPPAPAQSPSPSPSPSPPVVRGKSDAPPPASGVPHSASKEQKARSENQVADKAARSPAAPQNAPEDVLPGLMARLRPSQSRASALAILAEAGAIAETGGARSSPARVLPSQSAPQSTPQSTPQATAQAPAPGRESSPSGADAAGAAVAESESRGPLSARALRRPEPARDYEQEFRLPDARRLACRFKVSDAGEEDVLVRCVLVARP